MGIASPESTIASYTNFTTNVLPRIKDLGKTWDRIIYIRLFSSLLASILFCQLLRSLSGAQQSSGCDPLLPSVSQGFCWLNSRTFCIFCGQEQRGNEALSWRLYMPLYTPKTEPTKWDGKTVIKGFRQPSFDTCQCRVPSLSTPVRDPADMQRYFECGCSSCVFSYGPSHTPSAQNHFSKSTSCLLAWPEGITDRREVFCRAGFAAQVTHHTAVMAPKLTTCFHFHELDSGGQSWASPPAHRITE